MNILIPHKWLLEHLKTKAKPEQIQEYLSLSGPSVENITEVNGDKIYDIEITTNRPDALSVRGIAREAAVILSRYNIPATIKPLKKKPTYKLETQELPFPIIKNDLALCQRIMCIVLDNVQNKPSPKWMTQRLSQAGFQTHDSIIDITNYVTHDLGHPCHAFDYDKIMELGGVINVELAKPGRPFTTLDNTSRETLGGEIVFTNQVGTIIDLPAIIGTANSSVDKKTKRVLLWLEDLDPKKVRQASMMHAIRTIAAQLNEKELDPYLGDKTIDKAVSLYRELTGAKIASTVFDEFIQPPAPAPIKLNYSTCVNYLGIELEIDQISQILTDLGCQTAISAKTKKSKETIISVVPPSYRQDLQIPVDIIEEIARIYGYQNLPSQIMTGQLPINSPDNLDFAIEEKIKNFLANIGWQEVYTLSLVSQNLAERTNFSLKQHLELTNPLLTENSYLRRSLIPSLEEAIAQNPQREQLSLFELAAVYHPQKADLPTEEVRLGLVSTKSYRKVRGDLEALLAQFFLDEIEIEEEDREEIKTTNLYLQQGKILVNIEKEFLGKIFILQNHNIAIEINLAKLLLIAKKHPKYQPLQNTSSIIEDLTFTLPFDTKVGEIMRIIKQSSPLIIKVELKDSYQQNYTFGISYQHPTDNLSNKTVMPIRQKIVERVEKQTLAKLVGKV